MHTQQLESRRLMAGTAALSNGLLTINGSDGYDQLAVFLENGQVAVTGTNKNKELFSGVKRIKITANGGNDMVEVSPRITAPASIDGGTGNDAIVGGGGADTLAGAAGTDIIYGGPGNDVLRGGNDNDTLRGNAGTDALLGENGDDRLIGDDGSTLYNGQAAPASGDSPDYLDGAGGNDTIDFSGVPYDGGNGGYWFNLRASRSQGAGTFSDISGGYVYQSDGDYRTIARLANYETVIATRKFDNIDFDAAVGSVGTGTGVRKPLVIDGFHGNDNFLFSRDASGAATALLDVTLVGGRDHDNFDFDDTNDVRPAAILGGHGVDHVSIHGRSEATTLANIDFGPNPNWTSGDSLLLHSYAGGNFAMPASLEGLQILEATGSAVGATIDGNASDNRIDVPASMNIRAQGGNDWIAGGFNVDAGTGDDEVYRSLGTVLLGDGDDVFSATQDGWDAEIPLSVDGGAGNDYISLAEGLLTGRSRASIYGGAGNDTIYGSAGHDSIDLGSGNNWVEAGDGNDYINAKNGAKDIIDGGRGNTGASKDVDPDIEINHSPAST